MVEAAASVAAAVAPVAAGTAVGTKGAALAVGGVPVGPGVDPVQRFPSLLEVVIGRRDWRVFAFGASENLFRVRRPRIKNTKVAKAGIFGGVGSCLYPQIYLLLALRHE